MWNKRVDRLAAPKRGVFATFLCIEPRKIYKNNPDLKITRLPETDVYELTIFLRHDHRIGFIGGSAEQNESIEQTLIREVSEEVPSIENDIKKYLESNNYDVLIHTNGKFDAVLYVFKLKYEEFKNVVDKIKNVIFNDELNVFKELVGMYVCPIHNYVHEKIRKKKDRGLYKLPQFPAATFVMEEIVCILRDLLNEEYFNEIVEFNNIPEHVWKIK